jgi:nucleoside-diphosphate-sugar epimerase
LQTNFNHSNQVAIGHISSDTNWQKALEGAKSVVHLAARVHVLNDQSSDPIAEFRRVNVEGTVNLAHQAASAGVKRFIYLSSIKVNGEFTSLGKSFTADDIPAPLDAYAISKYEAECRLKEIGKESSMEIVIIRPPLVYGHGVKANFKMLVRLLEKGFPLPLGGVTQNRRSLVALDNLIDLILTCLTHQAAANQVFLVSDGEDLSTSNLLKRMGKAIAKPAKLFYMPLCVLKIGSRLINKQDIYQRLCGSLQLDISKNQNLLNWKPPITVDEGLTRIMNKVSE